ncbi:hypothetical protein [Agromyces italicus]|uniref:hypothetical protein n=1 Tax=Agromyces italicus TaxID=279572 RepID=UPI0003B4ABBD|nr:hypothetical protein [Agromyces italicus]
MIAATAVPSFRMLFPPGWVRHDLSTQSEAELLTAMRAKLRPYGRPDLEFQLAAAVKSSFRGLRDRQGIAVYLPSGDEGAALAPMSITATRLVEPGGGPLDARVSELFSTRGAAFLGDDRMIVRWTRTVSGLAGAEEAVDEQVNYLIPVPGSNRTSAVLLSTSIVRPADEPVDADLLDSCVALSDAIVSTFAWAPNG